MPGYLPDACLSILMPVHANRTHQKGETDVSLQESFQPLTSGAEAPRRSEPDSHRAARLRRDHDGCRPCVGDNIRTGDVCKAKVFVNSVHLCGTAPGAGTLKFTNDGVHIVAVFTIAAGTNTVAWDGSVNGAEQFASQFIDDIPVKAQVQIPVVTGDRIWIGRADHTISNRTISVLFDDVPGSVPTGEAPPEQKIEALVDAVTCPQPGLAGSMTALGVIVQLTTATTFNGESCSELAALFASGMSLLIDVTILEDATGALSATEVELGDGTRGFRRRGDSRGRD